MQRFSINILSLLLTLGIMMPGHLCSMTPRQENIRDFWHVAKVATCATAFSYAVAPLVKVCFDTMPTVTALAGGCALLTATSFAAGAAAKHRIDEEVARDMVTEKVRQEKQVILGGVPLRIKSWFARRFEKSKEPNVLTTRSGKLAAVSWPISCAALMYGLKLGWSKDFMLNNVELPYVPVQARMGLSIVGLAGIGAYIFSAQKTTKESMRLNNTQRVGVRHRHT